MQLISIITALILTIFQCSAHPTKSIEPGIAQIEQYLPILSGKQVAFVGNHTSYWQGKHSIDILRDNGINVQKIFAPEHGFRGTEDAGATVNDEIDSKTGIPIISL